MGKKVIKWQEIVGLKFGKLTVTQYIPGQEKIGQKIIRPKCVCICECGRETTVQAVHLRSGHTQSCGICIKHGLTNSPTYKCWSSMKSRCLNPSAANYPQYGGSGISICDKWIDSFEEFLADMGERPSLGHTLDRYPDKKGNYKPGNCRWSTAKEQARNKNNTLYVKYNNQEKSVSEWAEIYNVNQRCLHARIKRGWNLKEAIETPIGKNAGKKTNFISHSFGIVNA